MSCSDKSYPPTCFRSSGSYYIKGQGGKHPATFDAWSNIPDGLYDTLVGRNKKLPGVQYLALSKASNQDDYFVRFTDASYAWHTPNYDGLDSVLRSESDCTAAYFGPHGAYLVKHENGITYNNLPGSMDNAIEQWKDEHDGITNVAMGPDGEWFIRWGDGAVSRNSLHPSLERMIESGSIPLRIRLGPNGTFLAVFQGRTVWREAEDLSEQILSCVCL